MENRLRHYCRNPRCRSKLKEPVDNPRVAFCTRGGHSSFYLKRCLVCERQFVKKNSKQVVCHRHACRTASSSTTQPQEVPILRASKWLVVAGQPPTKTATIPDGPDCHFKRGEYERLEAKNRAAVAGIGDDCFTEPNWREVVSPDGVRCWVTGGRPQAGGAPSDWQACLPSDQAEADLSIPPFLKR
jgi:hypothetical protein